MTDDLVLSLEKMDLTQEKTLSTRVCSETAAQSPKHFTELYLKHCAKEMQLQISEIKFKYIFLSALSQISNS